MIQLNFISSNNGEEAEQLLGNLSVRLHAIQLRSSSR